MSARPHPLDSTRWGRRAVTALLVSAVGAGCVAPAATAAATTTAASPTRAASHSPWADAAWGDQAADNASTATTSGNYAADKDPGSLFTVEKAINARKVWDQTDSRNRQVTGQGVGVALLDSGVNPVQGLDGAGKLVQGPDLSIEANSDDLASVDTFGHGTHLAGIIGANDGTTLTKATLKSVKPSTELGVAPDSTIEAVKLATTDGSTDVSQVIAALDWVTQHPTAADGTPIRVINLSFGTDSVQPYQVDPVAAAAENAWKHGIVVVVSGGNEGKNAGRLTDPAIDPYVIAVGASDSNNKTSWSNPSVADFSSSGTAERHVDLLAPGTSITSLRSPGSFVDRNYPQGLPDNDASHRLLRGSGTSQAAAVVSGSVALLLQAFPDLTPDQVKYALTSTASKVNAAPVYAGAGQLDVMAAYNAVKSASTVTGKLLTALLGNTTQRWAPATGQGSIEAARGGYHLVDADGNELSGEVDVQGQPWDPQLWWARSTTLTAWQDGSWNGAVWTGSTWASTGGWDSARWSSARWSSARWSSARWSSAGWDSARWSSARWSSARWSSARWSDDIWGSAS